MVQIVYFMLKEVVAKAFGRSLVVGDGSASTYRRACIYGAFYWLEHDLP
jgi:hypothetical protein